MRLDQEAHQIKHSLQHETKDDARKHQKTCFYSIWMGKDVLHVESMFKIVILVTYVKSETLDFLYQSTDMVQWTLAGLDTRSEEVEFPHVLYP